MDDNEITVYSVRSPKLVNSKGFVVWKLYGTGYLLRDEFQQVLTEYPPDPHTSSKDVLKRWNNCDNYARFRIVLNLGEEPSILITSLLNSGASDKAIWLKLVDTHEKDNIHFKLNLRGNLQTPFRSRIMETFSSI